MRVFFIIFVSSFCLLVGLPAQAVFFNAGQAQNLPNPSAVKEALDRPLPKPPAFLAKVTDWLKGAWDRVKDFASWPDLWAFLKDLAGKAVATEAFRSGWELIRRLVSIVGLAKPGCVGEGC